MIDVYEYEGCIAGYSDVTGKVEIVELPEKVVCEIPHGRHINDAKFIICRIAERYPDLVNGLHSIWLDSDKIKLVERRKTITVTYMPNAPTYLVDLRTHTFRNIFFTDCSYSIRYEVTNDTEGSPDFYPNLVRHILENLPEYAFKEPKDAIKLADFTLVISRAFINLECDDDED